VFDAIILFDSKEKIRCWNPAATRIFGYKESEVLGKKLAETIIPKQAHGLIRRVKQEFANDRQGAKRVLEFSGLKKDGTEFPTETSISSVKIDEESFLVANVRDITDRKNVEHTLKQQRDILEVVTQNAGLLVMLITKDYNIFWANEAMKEKVGKDILNKKCYTRLHNRSDICPNCTIKRIFNGEPVATREDSIVDLNGNSISAQVTSFPVKDKNGKVFAALKVMVPTTQQKLMETKIKEFEGLYHAIFEQTPLGVLVVDPETFDILQFNNNAHRQLGYTREEFGKLRLSDLEAIETQKKTRQLLKTALEEGQTEFLTKHCTKTGEERIVLVNQRVIHLSTKKLVLVTCHDVTAVNRLYDAVRTSEEKFFGIADSIKDALILVNSEIKVTFWNLAAEKTFGYTSKEAVGKSIHELVLPQSFYQEAKDRLQQSVETFSETGIGYFTVGNVEVTGRRKDGSEFPAELSLSPLKLEDRWNAVGLVKDISQRKLAEQKLMEAEQRYHTLFNQAPLGVLVVDPETASIIEFNDLAHNQLGYSREEFECKTIFDIEVKESPHETKAHLKEMAQSNGQEFETLQRTKTGAIKNIVVATRPFKSAGKIYLHSVFRDITESKKIQQALAKSEAQYRQLIEVAQEGIWAIDNNFITTFVNPRMAQMLGYQESEMVDTSLLHFIDRDMVETVSEILTKFGQPDVKGQYDYAFPHKNGSHVDTTVTLSLITDDLKRKIGILAVVINITERKKAEKALKQSEELSRAIVANAPIGIATSDSTYHFVSANSAFCSILGYTEEELHRLTFKDISDPNDIAVSNQKMSELEKGNVSFFTQEKSYIKKDGTVIIGRVTINALRNQSGKPILFLVELEDITQRKQLEDDLRISEQKFRAISTCASDAIILSDEKDEVIYWNPAAEKTFGYPANQAIGKKLSDLVLPPTARQNHSKFLNQLNKVSTARRQFGLAALKKDGTLFPIDLSVVPLKLNGQSCFLSVIRDITEWKAMEEALRREKDLLESVTTSTNVLLSLVDRNYRVIWGNKVAKQTRFGGDIEGRYCYEVFAENPKVNCQGCGVKKVFENGDSIVRRDYFSGHNGKGKWVELISTPIKDKNGNVIAALEIALDIDERKQLQNKLAEYSQRLEEIVQQRTEQLKKTQAELLKSERLAAIGELAGMIGHDLRNPLSGIKNSAYYMKKKGEELSPTQAKEMLETIDKCVGYSNKIITDLLDYSREIRLALEPTSPKKLLLDSLTILGKPNKIQVTSKLSDTPALMVDQDRIKRVFINLLKNAFDAMPNGGKVTVGSRQVEDNLEISFTDTGVGISEEVLPKLFTPLFTTKAQGMGFGLAICKRIIEAHRGTIKVETVKSQGTTFTLSLPIKQKNVIGGENVWINFPESSLSTTMKQ
jgi:PAS domain S-box-containing protein